MDDVVFLVVLVGIMFLTGRVLFRIAGRSWQTQVDREGRPYLDSCYNGTRPTVDVESTMAVNINSVSLLRKSGIIIIIIIKIRITLFRHQNPK